MLATSTTALVAREIAWRMIDRLGGHIRVRQGLRIIAEGNTDARGGQKLAKDDRPL